MKKLITFVFACLMMLAALTAQNGAWAANELASVGNPAGGTVEAYCIGGVISPLFAK